MSATVSCDQAGVDAVSLACQQAAIRRAELRLVATAPAVRRLLAARGLDRLVAVYPSVQAAIAARGPDGPDPPGYSVPLPVAPWRPTRLRARPGPAGRAAPGRQHHPGDDHGASGSHPAGSGGPAASSASMNGHRCIRWPLILASSISTT